MTEENVLRSFQGKKVLITGGTGLIGRQVVDILDKAGVDVKIVSLDKIKMDNRAEYIFDPENAMVIPSLMYKIYHKENPVKIWGDGTAIRDFAYSRDVAEGIILALYYGTNSKFVNLGSGKGVSIKELIHYNPTTFLESGLEETWDWFIKNQDEYLKRKNYFKE